MRKKKRAEILAKAVEWNTYNVPQYKKDAAGNYQACLQAIQGGADVALRALLCQGYWPHLADDKSYIHYTREESVALLNAALAAPNGPALVSCLYSTCQNYPSFLLLTEGDFTSLELSPDFLTTLVMKNASLFYAFLDVAEKLPAENAAALIQAAPDVPEGLKLLRKPFIGAAANGNEEAVKTFIAHNVGLNELRIEALSHAAINGHEAIVKDLLAAIDPRALDESLLTELAQKNTSPAIYDMIKGVIESAGKGSAVARTTETGLFRVDDETIQNVQPLPNGAALTTVFNFRSGQQTSIYEKPGTAPAITVLDFDDINKGLLTTMRKELDALNAPATTPAPAERPAVAAAPPKKIGWGN